jgi:DNA-binding LacI/PurR family transcriptional regulator
MPKLVMDRLYRDLVRDIRTNYKIGETYLTLDQISARFKVSKLTAQRCIKKLAVRNMVQANPRSGIRIRSHEEGRDLAGRKIVMLTPYQDHKFSQAFLTGIQEAAEPAGIKAEHAVSQYPEQDTLGFGDYLLGLDADGVIALSFFGSALPFYHALTRGLDVVSDIHYPQLPILPVVETDNERHGRELGRRLAAGKFKRWATVLWMIPTAGDSCATGTGGSAGA